MLSVVIKKFKWYLISLGLTPAHDTIINLEKPLEKILKKGKYIAIKRHNFRGDDDGGSYEINLPYYGGGSPEDWFVRKDKLLKALAGQSICTDTFTKAMYINRCHKSYL